MTVSPSARMRERQRLQYEKVQDCKAALVDALASYSPIPEDESVVISVNGLEFFLSIIPTQETVRYLSELARRNLEIASSQGGGA